MPSRVLFVVRFGRSTIFSGEECGPFSTGNEFLPVLGARCNRRRFPGALYSGS